MSIDWDSEIKAPQEAILDLPQERITGDILRGRGPRRGNLERLIKYWRPIMRKPGGFRRCLVILADHPELYPLERICAWLHHETTGLWPNEGNHHEGGKLGPIVRAAKRTVKKPKKRKRRGKKSIEGNGLTNYEYGFKDVVSQSRLFDGLLVQPIAGRQNVLELKAAMFADRYKEVSDRKQDIEFKKVGIFGSGSAAGQAIQAAGSILLPGDLSDFRSPIRSQIYETLTPGGGRGLGLRRVVRGAGRGARNKYRCPPGFQKGGTFTNKYYSTCGAQILGIPPFGPGAFATGIERALARLARDRNLVRSIGDLKNNSNPYAVIRAAQIPFAPKKTSPTRRQTSVDLVLARIANGENVPTRFVRRDGVILEPMVSMEELGKLDEFDDMVDGSLITRYTDGILGEGSLTTFGTGLRDNYINIEDQGVVKVSRVGGELDQSTRNNTVRAFNASLAKSSGTRNPDRTAPLMDFIEASDGKFTVEFGEIKNNAFIPDNTAKNELIQVRSGNVVKLVPKWVYDTFLSRSAPRRLDADPIFELIEDGEKSLSPFFNAHKTNKQDIGLARDYYNLVNQKAARFAGLVDQAEMDVKAPRLGRALRRGGRSGGGRALRGTASAIFDNALGRWRCPPGTRRGGTFSDRLGSNCGYSLPANVVDNLGKATNAIKNIGRSRRKGERRKEKANRVANRLKSFNEKFEGVLGITESRVGSRLGRSIGQRRSVAKLDQSQEVLFSGSSVRDTLVSLQNDIEDVIQNGDKRDVEKVWEQLSKMANLEAGRLTDNTSQDSTVVRAGGQIQDLLDGFAKQIIDRPSGRQARRATQPAAERVADRRTQLQERATQAATERREKLGRLARNLVRGRSMRRTGQNIPDINKDKFYKDDGTLDEEFLTARRTDVANVAKSSKKRLQSVLGNRTRDDDKLDEQAVEFLKNTEVTDENASEVASVIGSLNTFREMRDLIADDDARFAVQFEDAVRRVNDIDANELLAGAESMTVRQRGDTLNLNTPTLEDVQNFRRGVQVGESDRSDAVSTLESRFGPTNVTQSIKQAAKDKRKAIRDRIDKRAYKQYVDGETVNQQLQDTLLENPNLPESVDAIASVSWEDHARLLALRDQQKLDLYTQLSDTLGPDEIDDLYEATGQLVVPSPNWDFTAGGTLDPKETRANFISDLEEIESEGGNIRDAAKSWVNHAFGTDPETGKVYPFKVGEVDVIDERGNRIKAIKEISVDITDQDIETTFGGSDQIRVSVPLTFTLRNSEDGSIIYQKRDKGMSWSEGQLDFKLDYLKGSASFNNAGTTHQMFQVPPSYDRNAAAIIPRPDELMDPNDSRIALDRKTYRLADPAQEVSFNSGGFMNTLSQRAMPFMKGSGLEELSIGSTAYTGSATWIKYGFSSPNTKARVQQQKLSLDEIIKDAERGLQAAANGTDIDVKSATALTLIGTPEQLAEVKLLRDASNPDMPEASPDAYAIFSVFNGLEPDGRLKRNTALYRAMTGDTAVRSDKDMEVVDSQVDEAQAAFGVTFTSAERPLVTNFEGNRYGFSNLASDNLSYDLNNLKVNPTSTITGEVDTAETGRELGDIVSKLTDEPEVDAYGKRLSSLGKRHTAMFAEEEKARYAASIERSLNKLVRDGVLSEEDPESRNLVNLASELRKSIDFPEESLGTGDALDNIAADLGDEATITALIDDLDFLREETDDIEFDRLKAVLQSSLEAPNGRSASKELTNPKKDPVPNFFQKHSEKFKGRKFRTNFFGNDDESEKNAQIAGQLTIFDELAEQNDRRNEVARRGIDSVMDQVEEVADREGISPEEVVERAAAHALVDLGEDQDDPLLDVLTQNIFNAGREAAGGPIGSRRGRTAGGPPASRREGPPPVAEITFNQGRIQDMRLMNNTLKTLLTGQINRADSDDMDIFNTPTILEDGTIVARLNRNGSFISKDQAQRMLAAVVAFDNRVQEAYNFFDDRSTPVPFVLAETEEELDQLISAFSLQSNVPGDDYLMLRLGNMVGLFEEAKARRNRPEGRNMLTTGSLGASPPMSRMDAAPNRRSIDNWVSAGGLPEDSELDEQIWNLSTQEGLSDREIAQRLDVSRAEITDRRISYRAALGASDVEAAESAQETVSNARRVDAYDADLDEIAEETNNVRRSGLPEGFSLSELIEETTPTPDVDVPDGDGDDAEIPAVNTNDVPMESLDDILTSLERRADRLQAALERLERNQFSDSGGRGRGRGRGRGPRGGPAGSFDIDYPFGGRPDYENMDIDELMDQIYEYFTSAPSPTGPLDRRRINEEAMQAFRRRLRYMSDEELQELLDKRGTRRLTTDPTVDSTGFPILRPRFDQDEIGIAIFETARRRGLKKNDPLQRLIDDAEDGADPTYRPRIDYLQDSPTQYIANFDSSQLDLSGAESDPRYIPIRSGGPAASRPMNELERDKLNRRRRRAEAREAERLRLAERRERRTRLSNEARERRQGIREGNPENTDFQKEVWRLRTEEGYTLEQTGELLGVDRGAIRQAEVNYARSLRPEDREAANIRARQAVIGRERAAAEADRVALNQTNLETYGDKVWELRTERGYTLEETARELGIDRVTVRRAEIDYGATLTPEQKERDYARGRAAAEIRQAVDTDDGPAASRLGSRRERSGPPAREGGPRRSDGTPPSAGPPVNRDGESNQNTDIFNAVHGGGDIPEGFGEERVAAAIQDHLNEMGPDERGRFLENIPADNRIFDHPQQEDIMNGLLDGKPIDELAREIGNGVSPEYIRRMSQAVRQRGTVTPELIPDSESVTAPLAPAKSGFRRLIDEVRVKLGRKARKDPEGKQIVQKLGNEGLRDLKGNKGFAKKFADEGFELHVVGGAVRDIVLGKKPKDFDLATDATPEQIARVLGFEMQEDGSFVRVQQRVKGKLEMTGDAFPVLRYTTGAGNEYEIATYRADLPEGGASIEGVSLRDDVSRRDLTMNGMAYDLATDEVIDHVGGLADLGASIDDNGNLVRDLGHVPVVRAIGDPAERLAEDPVRAIRAIRFAANTGGTLDPDTLQAIKSIDIENIPNERIRTELIKGLTSAPNTEALFKQLDESGLLQKMFPDLDLNPDEMNVKNLGSTNTSVHLAALLRGNDPEKVRSALRNLKYTNKEIDGVLALHELAEVTPENAPSTLKKLRNLVRPEGDGAPTLTRRDLMNYGEVHNIDPVTVGAMIDLIDDEPITFDSLGVDIPEGPNRSLAVNTAVSARFEELLEANSGNSYIKRNTELDELINRTLEGGGTFNLSRASNVTSGFAVSRNKKGVKFKRDDIVDENGEPTDEGRKLFYSFIANHLAEFGDDDRDGVTVSLGTWYDEENGDFYLDITDVFDSSKFTEADAIAMGKEQNQISIANLDAINDGETDGDTLFPSAGGDGSELLPMTELARFFPEYEASKATIRRDADVDADTPEGPKAYPRGEEIAEISDTDLVNLAREVANGDYGDENVDQRLENLARIARRRGQVDQEANLNLFNEIDEISKNRGVDAPAADVPDVDAPDADVTPDVDATPDVRTLDADALEGDALKSEIDSIVQEIMDGEGEIGADLEKLREAAEKAEEGYGREIQQRLLDKFAPSDDFLNERGRVDQAARKRFLNEMFEEAEGKITVNVTPLTQRDNAVSDDIAEGAEDAAQAATTPTTRVEKLQAAKAQLETLPGVNGNNIPLEGNRVRTIRTENIKPRQHAIVLRGQGDDEEDMAVIIDATSWDANSAEQVGGVLPKNSEEVGVITYEGGSGSTETMGYSREEIITIPKEVQDARANLTKINLELMSADPENDRVNFDPENFISDDEVDQFLEGTLEGAAIGLRDT